MATDDFTRTTPPQHAGETVSRPAASPDTQPFPSPADAADQPADSGAVPAFDHFRLLGELGRGGMGVVYRALDTHFMRDVAVKVLAERLATNRTAVRRFLEEARVTGQLTHGTIPPVHQVGTLADGRPFLAMKLIKGRTFDELLRERADPLADLTRHLDILEKVCEGVGYAHSRGVIHRDLKPANVMVGAFGEVQVMDWGLAKEVPKAEAGEPAAGDNPPAEPSTLDSESDAPLSTAVTAFPPPDATVMRDVRMEDEEHTRAGTVLGTPAYMSPEQAGGDVAIVGPRADVFSLGAVLCVILAGRPPYQGKGIGDTVQRAAHWETADAFRRLAQCKADPAVVELCKRCLAKDPADRPADGGEVAEALAGIRATAAERLRRADLAEMAGITRRIEGRKRTWWQVGLLAAAAVAIGGLLIGGWVLFGVKETERRAVVAEVDAERLRLERVADESHKQAHQGEIEQRVLRATLENVAKRARADREKAALDALFEADATLRGLPGVAEDAGVWDAALTRAHAFREQAGKLTPPDPSPALAAAVARSTAELKRADDDRRLADRLEELAFPVLDREQVGKRHPPTAADYREAFALPTDGAIDPPALAARVNKHPRPAVLREALFDWQFHATANEKPNLAAALDACLPERGENGRSVAAQNVWMTARKDETAAGTRVLLAAADRQLDSASARETERMFCDLWARGEPAAALRVLRSGLASHRHDYRLNSRLALHLWATGDPKVGGEAIRAATAAAAARPLAVFPAVLLVRLSVEQPGEPFPSEHLRRILIAHPRSVPAFAESVNALVRSNFDSLALQTHKRVAELEPCADARLDEVRVRWEKGERAGAVVELRDRVLPKVPREYYAILKAAWTCRTMYLVDEAEAMYRLACRTRAKEFSVRLEFADYLTDQASRLPTNARELKLREAERLMTEAATAHPLNYWPHQRLVFVHLARGDAAAALAAAERGVKLAPNEPDAVYALGRAQLAAKRPDEATATAHAFAKKDAKDFRGLLLLAEVAASQSKWADAAKSMEKAVELAPQRADVWNELGRYRGHNLDRQGAVAAFKKAIELQPNDALYHWNISGYYFSLFQVAKGLEHQKLAWELNPDLKGKKAEAPSPLKK